MKELVVKLALISFLLLFACSQARVVSYYVDNGIMQYFIRPIEFDGDNGDELIGDFTYRMENPVTFNFSVLSKTNLNRLNNVELILKTRIGKKSYKCIDIKILYIEAFKNKYRYTSKFEESISKVLKNAESMIIKIYQDKDGQKIFKQFESDKDFKKSMQEFKMSF